MQTSMIRAPAAIISLAMSSASSQEASRMRRRNFLLPATLVRSPMVISSSLSRERGSSPARKRFRPPEGIRGPPEGIRGPPEGIRGA